MKAIYLVVFLLISVFSQAQLPVPQNIGSSHPRCFGKNMSRERVNQFVEDYEWAHSIVSNKKKWLSKYLEYCEKEPDWLLSRLQMYWKTRYNQVYINGGKYHHAEGEAPKPTVRFPGTRNHITKYYTPRLEDVIPYMDDERGIYLQRRDNKQWEWTDVVSSAKIVESINKNILGIARDAAFMYWYADEEAYAQLAFGVLDTYLTGLYYQKEPIDLSHGHHQTLVGLTSFEVIQEHHVEKVTQAYDFLYEYIVGNHADKLDLYSASLQRWADQIIKNGVSFNNWNLFQAGHVSKIALVLENDSAYKNGKGAQYYLDQIMNQTSTRQWSMNKLIDYGYDRETGIWNESPGYSMGVLKDFIHFAEFYDHIFDIDLIAELPVLKQAVKSSAQYLYPNSYKVAFGDGHYSKLSPEPILYMIENAQKYNKDEDEIYFTKMLKTLFDETVYSGESQGKNIDDLFSEEPLKVRDDIKAGKLRDFVSPLFHAPNTSWLVQRQLDPGEGDLMISQIGSLGNHMHSNGIAMELYGYGLPLAPEMGHGSSYFSIEYAEYYTQFPAHNTVIVNGKSKYPEMKSNHAFTLNAGYPESGKEKGTIKGFTFSDVSFLEPETHSDQRRVMGIIANKNGGYYIDIFRSRQKEGNDIKHEYFYHNLGQELTLNKVNGQPLELQPTNKMAFGDGDLMAYDYMWDKKSIKLEDNFLGRFDLEMHDQTVSMNLWMRGANGREIFTVMSPKSTAFRHGPLPKELNDLPVPTLVVRQKGEAWSRPFVAVFEPALNKKSEIASVDYFGSGEQIGIHVVSKWGREDFIFSSPMESEWSEGDMQVNGTYAVISKMPENLTLFVGNGKYIASEGYQISAASTGYIAFARKGKEYFLLSQHPARLCLPVTSTKVKYELMANGLTYPGKIDRRKNQVYFDLPAMPYTNIILRKL